MKLEEMPCPLCGSNKQCQRFSSRDYRFKVNDADFSVVTCSSCGLLFLNPRPVKEEILRCYPLAFNKQDESIWFRIIAPFFRKAQGITVSLFKKYKKNGKILDIGCGNGDFLLTMKRQGYEAWGVEQNPLAGNFCDAALAGKILFKDIEKCNFPSGSFDIITSFHSLEHIYDLNLLLTEARRILKDDGIFYVCVPNMDFYEAKLFGRYYYNLDVPRHLYFFTQKTLTAFLNKNGFKVDMAISDLFWEWVSTPTSLYQGIWNYAMEKRMLGMRFFAKPISYVPLVALRLALRFFFWRQSQNLKVLCRKR